MTSVEAFLKDTIKEQHLLCNLAFKSQVNSIEVVLFIKHIEVFEHLFIGDVSLTETCCLVEDREGIAHTAISFLRNEVQGLFLVCYSLIISHMLEVGNDVRNGHTLEVIYLTT